jgi:hypothetical protein
VLEDRTPAVLSEEFITALHSVCGTWAPSTYRDRPIGVGINDFIAPDATLVPGLMRDFVAQVNATWATADPIALASYVLWRIVSIHPFLDGNGRTARAASYFVLCARVGAWLPGSDILPELVPRHFSLRRRAEQAADRGHASNDPEYLNLMRAFVSSLLADQLATAEAPGALSINIFQPQQPKE